jgi:putative transcriptional regulator
MSSFKGKLLVASPQMGDENFNQTVVLMLQHSEQGALGVVLNRPSGRSVAEVWEMVGQSECESDEPVYVGGPVTGPLIAVHTNDLYSEEKIFQGVFFAAQRNYLEQVVADGGDRYKLFSGYAGWGPGQLEQEVSAGAWYALAASYDFVFNADEQELWQTAVRQVGRSFLSETLHIAHVPDDPSLN